MTIHILDLKPRHPLLPCPADWYPLYLNSALFRAQGIRFRYFNQVTPALFQTDVLCLSSRFFKLHTLPPVEKKRQLELISRFKNKVARVLWFDFRDSSGTTQFEVLPYVDFYLKKQLLIDKSSYRRPLYGNRLYTDFIHQRFGITDDYDESSFPLPIQLEHKLAISWNTGLLDFRGGLKPRLISQLLTDIPAARFNTPVYFPWGNPHLPRPVNLLAIFNTNYGRRTVAWQRLHAPSVIDSFPDKSGIIYNRKLPLAQEINARYRTKIILSLFGWGELNSRDFQTFTAGSALLSCDVSHLETWPITHIPYQTYYPVSWDLSNLSDAYQHLLNDPELRLKIATQGQDRFRALWSREARQHFVGRLAGILSGIAPLKKQMTKSPLDAKIN